MTNRHLLAALAAMSLGHAAVAADTQAEPVSPSQSPCLQALQNDAQEGARRGDADIDGRGTCSLRNGGLGRGARTNAGVPYGAGSGSDDAAPLRHRFQDDDSGYTLRGGRRVTTIDYGSDEQRLALGARGWQIGEDPFERSAQYMPVAWLQADGWTAPAVARNGVSADSPGALFQSGQDVASAFPLAGGGPLTSRAGGRAFDAGPADTGPAPLSPVPEPASWSMLACGGAILMLVRRRRGRTA